MAISHERESLVHYLTQAKPADIGRFLSGARPLREDMNKFLKRHGQTDIKALIDTLKNGNRREIGKARDAIDQYVDARARKMPMDNIPLAARHKASSQDLRENLKKIPKNFSKAITHFSKGHFLRGCFQASAALTKAVDTSLSLLPLTRSERRLSMMNGVAWGSLIATMHFSSSAQAAVSPSEIRSAIEDFNAAPISETVTPAPLRIVVTPPDNLHNSFNEIVTQQQSGYLLSPYLVQKLDTHPNTRQLVEWVFDAARENDLDPVLFANQMYRESIHFSNRYVYGPDTSPVGAMGIAQFMEATGNAYGLHSDADFFDPQKSIDAGARYMRDLIDDYNGDVLLAMAAYNGGSGAVDTARKGLGRDDITGMEWYEHMTERWIAEGRPEDSRWISETRGYVADIAGLDWSAQHTRWAQNLQNGNPIEFVALKIQESLITATPLGMLPPARPRG